MALDHAPGEALGFRAHFLPEDGQRPAPVVPFALPQLSAFGVEDQPCSMDRTRLRWQLRAANAP